MQGKSPKANAIRGEHWNPGEKNGKLEEIRDPELKWELRHIHEGKSKRVNAH